MPNGPIKTVGDSTVSVALHTDVVVDITVTVYGCQWSSNNPQLWSSVRGRLHTVRVAGSRSSCSA